VCSPGPRKFIVEICATWYISTSAVGFQQLSSKVACWATFLFGHHVVLVVKITAFRPLLEELGLYLLGHGEWSL
jgi:hypothetical protein